MTHSWTFLTNHAQVFLCVAENSHLTAREIAGVVGITERAVQRILVDLEDEGYVQHVREGRSNLYTIDMNKPLRHPAQHGQPVRELLSQFIEKDLSLRSSANHSN